jgi:hypothetical protein
LEKIIGKCNAFASYEASASFINKIDNVGRSLGKGINIILQEKLLHTKRILELL